MEVIVGNRVLVGDTVAVIVGEAVVNMGEGLRNLVVVGVLVRRSTGEADVFPGLNVSSP